MNVQMRADGTPVVLIDAAEWREVALELTDAWDVLARAVIDYVAGHPRHPWDRVRLYARFESGFVWAAPDVALPTRAAVVCGFRVALVGRLYNELPDADEPEFDARHQQMADALHAALRGSALAPGARAALRDLRRVAGVPITFVEYDDLDTERVLVGPADLAEAA